MPRTTALAATGVAGLDDLLDGGLPRGRSYLIQGNPGAGKTTLGLQFALAGAQAGERVLYVATSESEDEIELVARSHGWSLDGVAVRCLDVRQVLAEEGEQSVFHAAEVELPKTIGALNDAIAEIDPERLVIDSLSEIRLLAGEPRWFRRQVLGLKDDLGRRGCTTLFCDDRLRPEEPLLSVVHGVVDLEQNAQEHGPDRRRLRVAKLRGRSFRSGYHDMEIQTGGIEVYPRLVASVEDSISVTGQLASGLPELDALLGGGIDRGASTLILGSAGTGKSTVALQFALSTAMRGERALICLFDERSKTVLQRASGLGFDLRGALDSDAIVFRAVLPAAISPGQLGQEIRHHVVERGVRLVVLDSLTGYLLAVPDQRHLSVHLHELAGVLGAHGATLLMVAAQHGLPGSPSLSSIDFSYAADTVLLLRHFEFRGTMRKAISAYKRRGGYHEHAIRELRIGPDGLHVGRPLSEFQGILTGIPRFLGEVLNGAPGGPDD